MRTLVRHRILAATTALAVALPIAITAAGAPAAAQSDEFDPIWGNVVGADVIGAVPDGFIADDPGDPLSAGAQYAQQYGEAILPEGSVLVNAHAESGYGGGHVVRLDQTIDGLPVFGAGIAVRLDVDGSMLSLSSELSREPVAAAEPTIAVDNAIGAAVAHTASEHAVPADQLSVDGEPTPIVYDPNLIGGDPNSGQPSRVVWDLSVSNDDPMRPVSERVLVNAASGEIDLSFSAVDHALDRQTYDCHNVEATDTNNPCTLERSEGEDPTGNRAVDTAFEMVGVAYNTFHQHFGRNSWDDQGSTVRIFVNHCNPSKDCPTKNLTWAGGDLLLGATFEQLEDLTVHEFSHGVIRTTADLMNYAETGAINESFADVFGEIADQQYFPDTQPGNDDGEERWLIGEDLPHLFSGGAVRSMSNPPRFGSPDRMTSERYWTDEGDDYGVHYNNGVSNKAAYLMATGGSFNGYTMSGIGLTKTAAVYYEALTGLMTPGTDYADLYKILPQACNNLIGKQVGPGGAAGAVTEPDCISVQKAVNATEMNKPGGSPPTGFRSISPTRLFDTRTGQRQGVRQVEQRPRPADSVLQLDIDGFPGSLADTTAVSLNVTAVNTAGAGFVTVYPCGADLPATSSVNFSHAGQFSANGLIVPVSGSGKLCFYTKTGTDLFADVNGFFTDAGGFVERVPERIFDTRGYQSDHQVDLGDFGQLGGERTIKLDYGDTSDLAALILNATATNTSGSGFVRVYPCLAGQPDSSNVNFTGSGQTVANGVITPLDAEGSLCFASNRNTDLTADINGVFAKGKSFHQLPPERLFDTRAGEAGKVSVPNGAVGTNRGKVLTVDMSKYDKVPNRAKAAVLNVTTVGATSPGFVTVYPCGTRPEASNVNFLANQVVANSVIAPISGQQKICFYASANTHIVADISGYLTTR